MVVECGDFEKVLHYEIRLQLGPLRLLLMVVKNLETIRPIENVNNALKLLENEADKFNTKKQQERRNILKKEKDKERKEKEINHAIRNEIIGNPNAIEFAKHFRWFIVLLTKSLSLIFWLIRDDPFFILLYPLEYIELRDSSAA